MWYSFIPLVCPSGSLTLGEFPRGVIFLPQRPYFPVGQLSLKQQVVFPAHEDSIPINGHSSSSYSDKLDKDREIKRNAVKWTRFVLRTSRHIIFPVSRNPQKRAEIVVEHERIVRILASVGLGRLLVTAGDLIGKVDFEWYAISKREWSFDNSLRQDQLSPGEQQRLSLARVLFHKPSLVILDEATASLSELAEKEVYDLLTQVSLSYSLYHIVCSYSRRRLVISQQAIVPLSSNITIKYCKLKKREESAFIRLMRFVTDGKNYYYDEVYSVLDLNGKSQVEEEWEDMRRERHTHRYWTSSEETERERDEDMKGKGDETILAMKGTRRAPMLPRAQHVPTQRLLQGEIILSRKCYLC